MYGSTKRNGGNEMEEGSSAIVDAGLQDEENGDAGKQL